ncbi:MAG: EndoU domain-containing protein [Stellaceae bacterium]
MVKRRLLHAFVRCGLCALLVLLPAGLCARGIALVGQWTATDPPVDFAHIETGAINRRGEAVGYHHRLNGVDPPGARVRRIVQPPDANGVYRARVALRDPSTGAWVDKRAASTFFPDAMSDDAVIAAVLAAFHDGRRRRDGRFVGDSGDGFAIEGWYHAGRIAAAYPLRGP